MPWAVAGAAVAAGGAIYASNKQSDAINNSSAASIGESQLNRRMIQEQSLPYRQVGENALYRVQDLSGARGAGAMGEAFQEYQTSPGYQYQVDQGVRAVEASAAARGLTGSGAMLKALQDRGQQIANQDFGTYYNRLLNLANMGQNSALNSAQQAAQVGQGISQTLASQGTAQAQIIGNTNAGVTNALNNGLNNYTYMQGMQQQPNALMNGNYAAGAGGYGGAGPFLG